MPSLNEAGSGFSHLRSGSQKQGGGVQHQQQQRRRSQGPAVVVLLSATSCRDKTAGCPSVPVGAHARRMRSSAEAGTPGMGGGGGTTHTVRLVRVRTEAPMFCTSKGTAFVAAGLVPAAVKEAIAVLFAGLLVKLVPFTASVGMANRLSCVPQPVCVRQHPPPVASSEAQGARGGVGDVRATHLVNNEGIAQPQRRTDKQQDDDGRHPPPPACAGAPGACCRPRPPPAARPRALPSSSSPPIRECPRNSFRGSVEMATAGAVAAAAPLAAVETPRAASQKFVAADTDQSKTRSKPDTGRRGLSRARSAVYSTLGSIPRGDDVKLGRRCVGRCPVQVLAFPEEGNARVLCGSTHDCCAS